MKTQIMSLLKEINGAGTGKIYSIFKEGESFTIKASHMGSIPFDVFSGSQGEIKAFLLGIAELCL